MKIKEIRRYFFRFFEILSNISVNLTVFFLSYFIRRKEDWVVLGSWCGDLYNDNSKYLGEYLLTHYHEKKIYWIGKEHLKTQLPKGYHFLLKNSLSSLLTLLKCKYMFCTQDRSLDISIYNVYRKAVNCHLDHGIPLKKCGMDDIGYQGELEYKNFTLRQKIESNLAGKNKKYDFMPVSSPEGEKYEISASSYLFDEKTIFIKSGIPRNDFLFHLTACQMKKIREKIASEYHFNPEKIIVAYLPTFRRRKNKVESFVNRPDEEMKCMEKILKKYNAVLLEKNHYVADQKEENRMEKNSDCIIKINKPIDFQELLGVTDIQIADYSGGFLDYLILDRPVIHYLYDYEYYRNEDSGLYYDKEEYTAGPVVQNFKDLLEELEKALSGIDEYQNRRMEVKNRFLKFEQGRACEKICKTIFGY